MSLLSIKPRVATINWNHPLSKGLNVDCPLFESAGTQSLETIAKIQGAFSGTANPTWKSDIFGRVVDFDGISGDALITYALTTNQRTPMQLTLEAYIYRRSYGAGNAGTIIRTTDGTASGFAFRTDSTNNMIFQASFSTTSPSYKLTTDISNNTWYHMVVTYDGTSSSNTPLFYQNGILVASSTVTGASGSWNNTQDSSFLIGNINQTGNVRTRTWDGRIGYVRYWKRILIASEIKSLYSNPFQLYSQPKTF